MSVGDESTPLAFGVVRRLCERPGCGAPAEVAYGIDKTSLLVWVDNRAILERELAGRLCRRHADALVPPRGWTLDDRREPIPKLFKVREQEPAPRPKPDRTNKRADRGEVAPVLEFPSPVQSPVPEFEPAPTAVAEPEIPETRETDAAEAVPVAAAPGTLDDEMTDDGRELTYESDTDDLGIDPDETRAVPWSPRLVRTDSSDDPSGPVFGRLLGRAFGVPDRESDEN